MAEPLCLHCEVAKLREERFPDLPVEACINGLLELVADYIGGEPSLEEQMRLFQFAEATMMQNRNEVLRGVYKRGSTPRSAGHHGDNGNG